MSDISISIGDFAVLLDKYVLAPICHGLRWIFQKVKPYVIKSSRVIYNWTRKKCFLLIDIIKEWRHPGQRKLKEEELYNLAERFHRSIILLEMTSSRYWWYRLYERKREDISFQQDHIALEEYGLIEVPGGVVRDSKPTRLGYRVAYVIRHYGNIPPIWYPPL